ncbi:MAG: UTRA domain-containing protein, partial [Gammaproteobacteria bacterium]|nr:UTRA domain-containing protein [Gammaproteobacteria bacterium]
HFFNVVADDGTKILPDSEVMRTSTVRASREESERLAIAAHAKVVRIERLRHLSGQPTIVETISLAARRFPGLSRLKKIPNTLYELYQREYGITIHRAEEQLSAKAASGRDAQLLGCASGYPLLRIVRVAWSIDVQPIELRVSRCLTTQHHYHNSIL